MKNTDQYGKVFVFLILWVSLLGCGPPVESRFDHTFFDGSISIKKFQINFQKTGRCFQLSTNEIKKLQLEIGKMSPIDLSIDDLVRISSENPLDVSIVFSDRFECCIYSSVGQVNQQPMLILDCPESGGFQGAVTKAVRLNKVLSNKRLGELGINSKSDTRDLKKESGKNLGDSQTNFRE